jgi:hypothetical protein
VVFLGPGANSELVPKFHVALHASHRAFPILTSKSRPKVALKHVNSNILPNATVQRTVSKFRSNTVRPCSTSHHSTFSTSERLTVSSTDLFQKDERALSGNLHSRKFICPRPVKCSASHYFPSTFSLLSLPRFGFRWLKFSLRLSTKS